MINYSYISVLELFKIGVGPSSSHTTGPMIAAVQFRNLLLQQYTSAQVVEKITVSLYGSLASTGRGHATDSAVIAGLLGFEPQTVSPTEMHEAVTQAHETHRLNLSKDISISFNPEKDIVFMPVGLAFHPNALRFKAYYADGSSYKKTYYSVGGGFVVDDDDRCESSSESKKPQVIIPYPFSSGRELLALCKRHDLRISDIVKANENALRPWEQTKKALKTIWETMQSCVEQGLRTEGILPGGLNVRRRAPALYSRLQEQHNKNSLVSSMQGMSWVNVFAMAVNEENAAGGRVVTAPTNGAAGILPAVLFFYTTQHPHYEEDQIIQFLLTASAIAKLCKLNASISGAEVGCQGEVGSACAMAAAGLAELLGGTPEQVENAAEIGLEHNLGLTCDPVAGLVQIPCIERNAIAAVKAINAAKLAIYGDGIHHISLDQAIRTMRDTGRDMKSKYKETSLGGLAVAYTEC